MASIPYTSPGVAVRINERTVITLPARTFRGTFVGMLFDTAKTFLLPGAIRGIKRLKRFFDRHKGVEVLVSGHTDFTGDAQFNLRLSHDRAAAVAAYLRDDADVWMPWYQAALWQQRWGVREDQLMLSVLPEGGAPFLAGAPSGQADAATRTAVSAFQEWSNRTRGTSLTVDGLLGPNTRRALVAAYMGMDGTTLPAGTRVELHGCGEFHPVASTPDPPPLLPGEDPLQRDRRVEVFIFDGPIEPSPPSVCPAPGCAEYLQWLSQTVETLDLGMELPEGPLTFSFHAPAEHPFQLLLEDSAGATVRALGEAEGKREGELLSFTLLPEEMPNPTQLQLQQGDLKSSYGGLFDPVHLRDLLQEGKAGAASTVLDGKGNEAASNPSAEAAFSGETAQEATPAPAFQLEVTVDKPLHRLVNLLTGELSAGGAKLEAKLINGRLSFSVPSTDRFTLTLEIPETVPNAKNPSIFKLVQEYTVKPDGQNLPLVLPVGMVPPQIFHTSVKSGNGQVLRFELDLTFLDVTEHVKNFPDLGFKDFVDQPRKCQYAVLEFTLGWPSTWCVIIPPAAIADEKNADFDCLLFFQHETKNTEMFTPDSASYQRLKRYFASTSPTNGYVRADPLARSKGVFSPFPFADWDAQLADSNRAVVMLFPLPRDGVKLGIFDAPPSNLRELLGSMSKCLRAAGRISRGLEDYPRPRRLAISGFSSGTENVLRWCEQAKNRDIINEIYLMDGKKAFATDALREWFGGGKNGRKLRLIGTGYTELLYNSLAALLNSTDATAMPGDPTFWYTDASYKSALSLPGGPVEKFKDPGKRPVTPEQDASDFSNIFLDAEIMTRQANGSVSASITLSSPNLGRQQLQQISSTEAASFVRYQLPLIANIDKAVSTQKEFNTFIDLLQNTHDATEPRRIPAHRHPWSAFGGFTPNPDRGFVRFLQHCLEISGFSKGSP